MLVIQAKYVSLIINGIDIVCRPQRIIDACQAVHWAKHQRIWYRLDHMLGYRYRWKRKAASRFVNAWPMGNSMSVSNYRACRTTHVSWAIGMFNTVCLSWNLLKFCGIFIKRLTFISGSWFFVECNICSCFAGDITCTRKQCRMPGIIDHFTSIPCNCGPHYVPVCGRNGYTYPSECVSKCSGLQVHDIEYRSCGENNPCRDAKCPSHTQCIENRQICLSVMHKPCRQYQCGKWKKTIEEEFERFPSRTTFIAVRLVYVLF